MIEVRNRSEESWGPLANVDQKVFDKLMSKPNARDEVKSFVKKQKKLKNFKVTFIKQFVSEQFVIQAESEYDVSSKAREFFKENKDTIEFAPKVKSTWDMKTGVAVEYDQISSVRVFT